MRNERELENLKLELASQQDFNLITAWQMLDPNNKGWLTGPDLLHSLELLGVQAKKDEVYLFLMRYDRDSDGRLLYSDFCEAFSPRDNITAALLSRRAPYPGQMCSF